MQATDPSMHLELAEVIFSKCRVTCFDFFRENRLWRTRYSLHDINEPKLFQLNTGGFPKSAGDLTLRDWLVKIKRASDRINEYDTIHDSDIYDFEGSRDIFSGMMRLCSLINSGKLDIENFEESFLLSLQVCGHLNGWEFFGRLKMLWEELHRPSADIGEAKLELDLERLKPPPGELRLPETSVPYEVFLKESIDPRLLPDFKPQVPSK